MPFCETCQPQLDPVRVFSGFASHPSVVTQPSAASMQNLPDAVREQRAPLWQLLAQSLPNSERSYLERDLVCKHHQIPCEDQQRSIL